MELIYIKNDPNYKKSKWEKLPRKFDPENKGLGCAQPRKCNACGWNPAVANRRNEMIERKRKEEKA